MLQAIECPNKIHQWEDGVTGVEKFCGWGTGTMKYRHCPLCNQTQYIEFTPVSGKPVNIDAMVRGRKSSSTVTIEVKDVSGRTTTVG